MSLFVTGDAGATMPKSWHMTILYGALIRLEGAM
jgi:hypothetical protein